MALITRVTRLFTADLHAVLDRLEEPDVLVKQAIREMEDELASRETRLRWLDHEHAQLTRQSADMNASLDAIAQQLDVCFASNEDALARPLIKRRLETQHLVGRLAARLQTNAQARVEETANVENNRRDLDAMRQKAEVLLDEAGSAGGVSVMRLDTTVTDSDIEVELLREKQARALLEDPQAGSRS
jgi:phage shock protein A